jgi:hypothetical protein
MPDGINAERQDQKRKNPDAFAGEKLRSRPESAEEVFSAGGRPEDDEEDKAGEERQDVAVRNEVETRGERGRQPGAGRRIFKNLMTFAGQSNKRTPRLSPETSGLHHVKEGRLSARAAAERAGAEASQKP